MPRFSVSEKENIREDIIKKGKELFSTFGLKKTTIDEIVQACGIGKGTFYSFYGSKEELYFEILEREEAFKDILVKELLESDKPVKESFREFFLKCFEYIEKSPLLKKAGANQDLDLLFRKLPRERIEEHYKKDAETAMRFIGKWQQEGKIKQEDPEVIVGILRSMFAFVYFKEEIGEGIYPRVIEKVIDYIVDGICVE